MQAVFSVCAVRRPATLRHQVACMASAVGLDQIVPFALESRLKERGAKYESAALWSSFAVRDGKLVTGQNPASSLAVAQATLAALD
jgi:putative intracellular protease/amidase